MWKLGVKLLSFVLRRGLNLDWVCVCYCLLCTFVPFVWVLLGSMRSDIDCPVFFLFLLYFHEYIVVVFGRLMIVVVGYLDTLDTLVSEKILLW